MAKHVMVGLPDPRLDDGLRALLDRGVGGVILFSRNVKSPAQVAELVGAIKAYAGRPIVVGVDQEGGRVARLRAGFTALPTMRALGARGDADQAHAVGAVIGRELRAVGIDVAFAPVLDVDTNPANPVIGDRSLSRDPAVVAELGVAVARGIVSAGVAACGKHFPGHGDTRQDSHLALPRLPHGMERLEAVELTPFRAAINNDIASIMTSHIVFEALDPDRPATCSPTIITGLLREKLGFGGVVFSDCMEMKAIADGIGTVEATLAAVRAGVDMVLISHDHDLAHRAIDQLAQARREGQLAGDGVAASNQRLARFTERFVRASDAPPALSVLDCEQHRRVVERMIDTGGALADPTEQ